VRSERFAVLLLVLLVVLVSASPAAGQATFQVLNGDAAGTGLNDTTPVSPVGGNTATTLGAQRMAALQYGLSLWASRINSSLPIRVQASFSTGSTITCTATQAILAFTGPQEVFRDDPTFPQQGVWYAGALANELSGQVQTTMPEMTTTFSGKIGTSACPFPASWYLGFDGAASGNQIDFVAVVNHEIAHGLGFLTFVDKTGAELADTTGPFPDAFEERLFDLSAGLAWPAMTDAQRAASSTDSGNLVWTGPQVEAKSSLFSSGVASGGRMKMYAPTTYSDGSSVSHWDTSLSPYEALEPYYKAGVHGLLVTGQALADTGWTLAGSVATTSWILPSSVHSSGLGGAFYTTNLTVANTGTSTASVTLKFLGHDQDGSNGPTSTFTLFPGASVTYPDVLVGLFGAPSPSYGAILITAGTTSLNVVAMNSTPNPGGAGTFGQSVPALAAADLVTSGSRRTIVAVTDDANFRTNLILANATSSPVTASLVLLDSGGATIGSSTVPLLPLEMTQVLAVGRTLAGGLNVTNATLVLSTSTTGGSFAAYASVIDNGTNDPRTLLAR
jgi:hypothetical protein